MIDTKLLKKLSTAIRTYTNDWKFTEKQFMAA